MINVSRGSIYFAAMVGCIFGKLAQPACDYLLPTLGPDKTWCVHALLILMFLCMAATWEWLVTKETPSDE